jgi:putative ABC transport system permease protein
VTERLELKKQGYSRGLRTADLGVIDSGKELVQAAAPVVFGRETALLGGRSLVVNIEGITPAYGVIRNRTAEKGRFLVDRDLRRWRPCVIGNQLAKDVYGTEDPLGREIAIRGVRFRIVGVLRSLGSSQVNDGDRARDNRTGYLPLTPLQKHLLGGASVQAYAFKVHDPERLKEGQKEVEALLRRGHRGISDFKVMNIGEEILRVRKEVDKLIANWTVVLACIAGISLLVGGIGIFSVMQISISERVYESVWQYRRHRRCRLRQFLVESVSLSLVAGCSAARWATASRCYSRLRGRADRLAHGPAWPRDSRSHRLTAGVHPALKASCLTPSTPSAPLLSPPPAVS